MKPGFSSSTVQSLHADSSERGRIPRRDLEKSGLGSELQDSTVPSLHSPVHTARESSRVPETKKPGLSSEDNPPIGVEITTPRKGSSSPKTNVATGFGSDKPSLSFTTVTSLGSGARGGMRSRRRGFKPRSMEEWELDQKRMQNVTEEQHGLHKTEKTGIIYNTKYLRLYFLGQTKVSILRSDGGTPMVYIFSQVREEV